MTDAIKVDNVPMVSPEAFNTQTSAPMGNAANNGTVESVVPVSGPSSSQLHEEGVKQEDSGDAMQVEETSQPQPISFSVGLPSSMQIPQAIPGSNLPTPPRIEPTNLLPLSSSSPSISSKEWEGMIRNVATLEQELGPDNLQVGKAYLFLARVLQVQGTPPALSMAQHALQRAYEILVHWKVITDGTKVITCSDSFQYLVERIQKQIEVQQQPTPTVTRS